MEEFKKRALIGFIGFPLILIIIYLGGPVFLFFIETLILLSLLEYFQIAHVQSKQIRILTIAAALSLSLVLYFDNGQTVLRAHSSPGFVLTLYILAIAFSLVFRKNYQLMWQDTLVAFFGLMYFVWSLSHLLLIREQFPLGREYTFLLFMIIWAVDTGAYAVGMKWGRRKLLPQISPMKSWEGAIGGTICGIMVMVIGYFWLLPQKSFLALLIIAIIVSIVAQISDLSESAIKRIFGVKDSGTSIPGHGGVLDRFDSFLLTSPILYYLILFLL